MINADELEICRRRGHMTPGRMIDHGWAQCKSCGMWLREIIVREEREDEPPEDEIDPLIVTTRLIKSTVAHMDEIEKRREARRREPGETA
jgi:hypothetical protein